jgi:hypothetical protein
MACHDAGRIGLIYYRYHNDDNTDFITADVFAAVAETLVHGAQPLFISGLAGLGFLAHSRKRKQAD